MSISTIDGDDGAVLYCNTTMWAFGPVFEDAEAAWAFKSWLNDDPRSYHAADLEELYGEWLDLGGAPA